MGMMDFHPASPAFVKIDHLAIMRRTVQTAIKTSKVQVAPIDNPVAIELFIFLPFTRIVSLFVRLINHELVKVFATM